MMGRNGIQSMINYINVEKIVLNRIINYPDIDLTHTQVLLIEKLKEFKLIKKNDETFYQLFGVKFTEKIIFEWIREHCTQWSIPMPSISGCSRRQAIKRIKKQFGYKDILLYHQKIFNKLKDTYPDAAKKHSLIIEDIIEEMTLEQSRVSSSTIHGKDYYRNCCRFILDENIELIDGYNLLKKYGWYKKDLNEFGVVKDHKYSINQGYLNRIDPKIMSHPMNCEFLFFRDNLKKSDQCSISFDELQLRIQRYKNIS